MISWVRSHERIIPMDEKCRCSKSGESVFDFVVSPIPPLDWLNTHRRWSKLYAICPEETTVRSVWLSVRRKPDVLLLMMADRDQELRNDVSKRNCCSVKYVNSSIQLFVLADHAAHVKNGFNTMTACLPQAKTFTAIAPQSE